MPTNLQPVSPHKSMPAAGPAAATARGAPRAAWPTQTAFLARVEAVAEQQCHDAFDRFSQARKEAAACAATWSAKPPWPVEPEIMHPELHASCLRREGEEAHRVDAKKQEVERLWRAYNATIVASGQVSHTIARLQPPPRLVQLVGGFQAFANLPELARSTLPPTHPIMRGQDGSGRLFVTITFRAAAQVSSSAPCGGGVITLMQSLPSPDSPWIMLNPSKFRPPGRAWASNLAPAFPNMAGRGALVGGPDAQAMLAGLHTLIEQGTLGPYRLGLG